jgi:ElaA protein
MQDNLIWEWHSFAQLSPERLYQLLKLRAEVFVVEQKCPYQDLDGKDLTALHLLGWKANENSKDLAAAARLLIPIDANTSLSFGRVVVSPAYRGLGYGEALVSQIMDYLRASPYQGERIVISAQYYLVKFYQKFGFKTQGDTYDEDGIQHIKMVG